MSKYFRKKREKVRKSANFIKIDFSFAFIFVLSILLNEISLYVWFAVFGLLHEFAHFWCAKKLGYMSKNIRLNFFGATLEGCDDFLLEDEIKVALAGPFFNLCVIILCYLLFWFFPESYHYLNEILLVNLSLFFFNFLPVFPLDFGRVLLAFFSIKFKRNDALLKVRKLAFIFIFLLFVLCLVSCFFELNLTLGFVVINLLCLSLESSKDTSFKRTLFAERKRKLIKKGLIERKVCVGEDLPLWKLLRFVDDTHFVSFMILNSDLKVVDEITEIELYKKLGIA